MNGRLTPYTPPSFEIGTPILWYANGDTRDIPQVGFIISPYNRGASVLITREGSNTTKRLNGCYHIDDPILKDEGYNNGAWDFTPAHKLLLRLVEIVTKNDREMAKELEKDLRDPFPNTGIEQLTGELFDLRVTRDPTWGKAGLGKAIKVARMNSGGKEKEPDPQPQPAGSTT